MSSYDIVIRGGTVIDGTGTEGVIADVAISGDRIAEIGKVDGKGAREIDAEGHIVCPGFVDGHTHMDAQVNWDPIGRNSCWHGITTVVMGNCGFSVAPVRTGEQEFVVRNIERAEDISPDAMAAGMDWNWQTFDEYLDAVDALPKGINYSAYVGHSALRCWAMGERAFSEEATEDDLAAMKGELTRALDAGAIGFSTSRSGAHLTFADEPVASRFASRDEVEQLVGLLSGRKNAAFEIAQEMHPPGTPEFDEYYGWLSDLTLKTGVTCTYGILGMHWREQIRFVEKVREAGGRMIGQTHSRGVTTLTSFHSALPFDGLPVWREVRSRPLEAQLAALKDPETRAALIGAIHEGNYPLTAGAQAPAPVWEKFFVYDRVSPPWRSVADIAREAGKDPAEVVIDLAVESELEVMFMQPISTATEDDLVQMMRHPQTAMTFSDSGAHVSQIADSSIQSHLIAYFWREKGLIPLEECIQMITSRPAAAWGFADRGVLKAGNMADINIFDPKTFGPEMPKIVNDLPTGARRLSQKSKGMKATLVAGQVFIENGEHTGALPGKLLRRADA